MAPKRKGAAEEGKEMITDQRFSKAHTDPRFRRVPRRESKVTIDARFKSVLSAKASAPVDKRGKRRRRGSAKDSLKEYYRVEEDDNKKKKQMKKEDSEEEDEQELMEALASRRKSEQFSEEETDEESKSDDKLLASSDEESDESAEAKEEADSDDVSEEEVDEDTDYDSMSEEDGPEIVEEEIASIEKETHRLAIVNMDWRYVSAKDLYVVFNSFLPKDGRLLSVAVYPSDFGLERMKEEEIHGPAIGADKKNDDEEEEDDEEEDEDDEEEDEDVINERLRDYEKSRLRYYFAVAECDSSATADHLYKSCDGIEFERSSNKLDLRFIPDSMEFKHPPRDIATEAPSTYQGLDFQSQALQMSRVNVSWDEDEPHRVKTLNQRFNPDQLAELELKEFLASDGSDSDDDEEKRKENYRALMESGDVASDEEEDEKNDQDMEIEFNPGLEDLSKKFLEKKDKKPETVWEAQLSKQREKKRARRMQKKDDDDDDSSDGDDSSDADDRKKKKKKKKAKGLEEKVAADERSVAELELLLAGENGGVGKALKGYNIKGKGKKEKMAEEKIPSADLDDDSRFSAALTNPDYALDPTNPQFKRSATYVKQLTQKQKEDRQEQVKAVETKASNTDGTVGSSKKRSFSESATVKSLKLKMQQKVSEKKNEGTAELAQRVKKKAKALSIKS